MYKLINIRIILIVLLSVTFWGCDDIFDAGDADNVFDDNPQVEFKPLSQEIADDAGTVNIAVQLIGVQRDTDVSVNFTTDGTAVEGVHYNLATASPVVIERGTSSADVMVNLIQGSVEGEVSLVLTIEDASDGVIPAENLRVANIFIQQSEAVEDDDDEEDENEGEG